MARFEIRISGKELREHIAAKALLRRSGLSLTDAARIALERERERRAEEKARNVAFSEALDVYLHEHRHLRARTLSDYRYQGRRLAAAAPDFCRARLRTLSAEDCARALDAAFPRARQRKKGLALLCAVFNFAMRKRWAEENPAKAVPTPRISEKEIAALAPEEIEALKKAAEAQGGPRALAALGLMLYAGVRPAEMLRLTTADVDLEERVVCIASRCSKTGGPRHVSVAPPLYRILKNLLQAEEARGERRGGNADRAAGLGTQMAENPQGVRLGARRRRKALAAGRAAAHLRELPPEALPRHRETSDRDGPRLSAPAVFALPEHARNLARGRGALLGMSPRERHASRRGAARAFISTFPRRRRLGEAAQSRAGAHHAAGAKRGQERPSRIRVFDTRAFPPRGEAAFLRRTFSGRAAGRGWRPRRRFSRRGSGPRSDALRIFPRERSRGASGFFRKFPA